MAAGKAVDFASGKAEHVYRYAAIPCCDNDREVCVEGAEMGGCSRCLVEGCNGKASEGGEFEPVRGDPGDHWEELVEAVKAVGACKV